MAIGKFETIWVRIDQQNEFVHLICSVIDLINVYIGVIKMVYS